MTNGALAYFRDGIWEAIAPHEGWTFYVKDEDQHVVWSGAVWGPILSASQTAGFRNRLHNAAFNINQRGAGTFADDAYCFDRWYVLTQTGSIAISAFTDPDAVRPTAIRLTQSQASAQRIGLAQIVESVNIRDLRSQAATMAARIRCSSSQAIRMAILELTGTADTVTSDIVNNWASTTYSAGNFLYRRRDGRGDRLKHAGGRDVDGPYANHRLFRHQHEQRDRVRLDRRHGRAKRYA